MMLIVLFNQRYGITEMLGEHCWFNNELAVVLQLLWSYFQRL